jgi:hypothetical protein
MERDLSTAAGSMVTEQRLGRPEYCTDGKGSGTVAGSMDTEQRFGAS